METLSITVFPSCYLWPSYLLLAINRAVPESVSPALVNSGDCSKQRTWYQWVRGSVGAVESHTVILKDGGRDTQGHYSRRAIL